MSIVISPHSIFMYSLLVQHVRFSVICRLFSWLLLWNHKPAGLPVFTSCCWVWKDKHEILLDQKKKSKAEPAAELLSSSKSIFLILELRLLARIKWKIWKNKFYPEWETCCDALFFPTLGERCLFQSFSGPYFPAFGLNTDQKLNTDTFNVMLGIASHQILGSSCLTLINHWQRHRWLVSLLLTLAWFHLLLWCLHCWLWASKYRW